MPAAATFNEPSELDLAILDRLQMGFPPIGPLTREQQENEDSYLRYHEEMEAEYQAQQAAGGRTICPSCGQRAVKHSSVVTLGYAGHPGAEYSDYGHCENCGHKEL